MGAPEYVFGHTLFRGTNLILKGNYLYKHLNVMLTGNQYGMNQLYCK